MLDIYRQQSVEQLDAKKSAMALQITNLDNQTKQWGAENLELSRKSAQYARLKAKSDRIQTLYDSLLATLQTLDVNKEISPESVTIYEAGERCVSRTKRWSKKDSRLRAWSASFWDWSCCCFWTGWTTG